MTPTDSLRSDPRPLSERIRPGAIEEMVGNRSAVEQVVAWAQEWSSSARAPRWRAVVLAGPPGVGKTTLAGAVARQFGWTIVEMNASDARNQSAVEEVAGRASLTHTLGDTGIYRAPSEGGRTLILVDEADCMTGGRGTDGPGGRVDPVNLREFLRGRYATIDALNTAWALGTEGRPSRFSEWTQLPASGGRAAWARLPEAQRDIADWKGASRRIDRSDRGGYAALAKLVRETRQPVILTVNDESELSRRAPGLAYSTLRIRFGPVRETEMRAFLRRVVLREGLSIGTPALDAIVARSHGDLRAAVNDLEAIAPLPPGPLQSSVLAVRNSTSDLFDLTGTVLTQPRFYRSGEIRDRADATPEDIWPWIEENVPRFAPGVASLEAGLERLGRAELLVARARRQRVYALWSFASELMTGGIGLTLSDGGGAIPGTVAFPRFLSEMGRSRALRATREGLLQKAGRNVHASKRKANESLLPFLRQLYGTNGRPESPRGSALRSAVARELGLTVEELELLGGRSSDASVGESSDEAEVERVEPPKKRAPRRARSATPDPAPVRPAGPRTKIQKRLPGF